VASVPLAGPVGGTWPTWSWLAACIVGILPVLASRRTAAVASVAAVAVAVLLDRDALLDAVVIAAGVGAGIAAVNGLQVWFWDLLLQAEQGRTAQARLAATEERLRFARDVHDLLGHHLSVIALKAELAERLVAVDDDRARAEAAEVRRLAASTLAELRAVVHGYRQVDLRAHLAAIEQVLQSSGVRCTVTAPAGDLPAGVAAPLAAVLREATTNVLRHSTATWCTIDIEAAGDETRMTVVNDGAGDHRADAHSYGLRGLAERLAGTGGVLRTRAADGRFTLEAAVPSTP
jgi:two-component system sensor histidine kinase DesK